MRRYLRIAVITLSFVLWSASLVAALSDEEAEALLREAHNIMARRGDYDSAIEVYDRIASEYAGSKWAAIALLKKAGLNGGPDVIPLYEQVVSEYPGTIYDINARLNIIGIKNRGDTNAQIAATSSLAVSLGGPSLDEVLASTNHQATERLFALPLETRKIVGPIYWNLWCLMSNKYIGLDRSADAFEVTRLLREVFEPVDASVGNGAVACLDSLSGGEFSFGGKLFQAPEVQILEPSENMVVPALATFRVEISAGDFEHKQVDLANTQFLVDGKDLMPLTAVRSDFSLQPGEPFERLSLTAELSEPLPPGPHSLSLVVPLSFDESGTSTTTVTRNFLVEGTSEPLTLQVAVDSKHVKPHRNENVVLIVTPSNFSSLGFSIYRVANRNLPNELGDLVYSRETDSAIEYEFIWSGEDFEGKPVGNGDYDVVIEASDLYGNESQTVVSVQVNRKGKLSLFKAFKAIARLKVLFTELLARRNRDVDVALSGETLCSVTRTF